MRKRHKIKLTVGALAVLSILGISNCFAESSSKTNVSVEVKQGCNVTAQNNEHTGSISNGTYSIIGASAEDTSGSNSATKFTIACNGNNKYDIYAVGYTNDTEGNNKLVGDKDSENKYNIVTGINKEGEISNWAFKLSEPSEGLTIVTNDDNGNNFTNYSNIPGASIKVAGRPASTVNNTTDTFKSTYAAYISKSQPADTYHGKVKYTLMDNGTTEITNYSITYDINDGDASSLPSPNPQTGSTLDSTITLSDTTPVRDGYEFVGWCSTNPGDSDTCPEGGKSYEVGGSYPLNDGAATKLYATWRSSVFNMQDVSTWGPDLQEGETVKALDIRDNSIYTVSKLKDGKVWMTSNLRIGDDKLTTRTLTSDTSDVSSNLELPDNSLSSFNSKSVYVNDLYGGYYGSDIIVANNRVNRGTDSICPKGWRPPTNDEFSTMVTSYGSDASLLQGSPINLGLIGYITSSSLRETDTNGYYWTSTGTTCGENNLYKISINEISADETDGCSRNNGASLRCIMRQSGESYDGEDRYQWWGECKPC